MTTCHFSDAANADLDDIHDFIATNNVSAARRVVITIREQCERLARSPLIGIARPDRGPGYRSFPVRRTPYIVIYRPVEDGVEIIQVRHGHRNA